MKLIANLLLIASIYLQTAFGKEDKKASPQGKLTEPQKEESKPKLTDKNQKEVFPDRANPPTASFQLPSANRKAQKMSGALSEIGSSTKLSRTDFLNTFKYAMYNLTRGEAEQIFLFADVDHDDLVSQFEWSNFVQLYILPFEACDETKDNLLEFSEFKQCFDKDPNSKLVEFKPRHEEYKHRALLSILSTRGNEMIDFNQYLFLRKTLFGWKQCQSHSTYISKSNFQCAIRLAVPQKYSLKLNYENIYDTGIKLANDRSLIELDYIQYLRTSYFTYYFTVFGNSEQNQYLSKVNFQKAIKEDRLPHNFEEKEVDTFYNLINNNPFKGVSEIDFETFGFFFNLHLLFNKYSHEKPLLLNKSELTYLLNDTFAPINTTLAVDVAHSNFNQEQYLRASLVLQKLRPNEQDFFYSFMEQDASARITATNDPAVANYTTFDIYTNYTNRHAFFNIMRGVRNKYWTKTEYYRAFQLANLFTTLATDVRREVSVETLSHKLNDEYDIVKPSFNMEQRKNYDFYKHLPKEINLDLLTFLEIENYSTKVKEVSLRENDKINENQLKQIEVDFNMQNMPDTVLDTAMSGKDQLGRRMFETKKVFRHMIMVQAVAAEQARNTTANEAYKLPINNDPSRTFPEGNNRHGQSELV